MASESLFKIGVICNIGNRRIKAQLLPEIAQNPEISIENETYLAGQVGSFVLIKQGAFQILAQVMASDAMDNENITQKVLLSLVPLGELNHNQEFQRGLINFPTIGAEVFALGVSVIRNLFASFNRYRYKVGYMSREKALGVSLNPNALFGRHLAILGQSGSGKSWAVASLLQKAVERMPGAHIIILDLHGEYGWQDEFGTFHGAFKESEMRSIDATRLEVPYWLMRFAELVDLFVDRKEESASVQIAYMRELIFELKNQEAKKLGVGQVSIDSPVFFSLNEMLKRIKQANEERSDFGKSKGVLFGQFDTFLIRMQSRLSDVRYDFLFKPKHYNDSQDFITLLQDFVGLGQTKRALTVINLSSVPSDVQPTIAAQIGRIAFEFNFWNPDRQEFPIFLLCEEAHSYIPRGKAEQFQGSRLAMERIAKEGRKYGVGLGLVTQRPHELSETVLSQCGTFICLRLTNPDDQNYVRQLVPESESDLIDILASLGRGEALVLGEAAPLPLRFQIYKPDPQPNSNDVEYHTHWAAGGRDINVGQIVDRWRRQNQV